MSVIFLDIVCVVQQDLAGLLGCEIETPQVGDTEDYVGLQTGLWSSQIAQMVCIIFAHIGFSPRNFHYYPISLFVLYTPFVGK